MKPMTAECRRETGADLVKAFANPILADLDLERKLIAGSVRDVEL